MRTLIKNYIIDSIVFKKISNKYLSLNHAVPCYGQNAEDIFLSAYFKNKQKGFYVDIGAHHPIRFSNTYQLYQKGWRGINIDPLPGCMAEFNRKRPLDINLEMGIGKIPGHYTYYSFAEPAYNTVNEERACDVIKNRYSTLKRKIEISINSLKNIFNHHINCPIDLLTIDVEGFELDILSSNDWEKYRPQLIIMESLTTANNNIFSITNDDAINYVIDNGYSVIGKMLNAVFLEKAL